MAKLDLVLGGSDHFMVITMGLMRWGIRRDLASLRNLSQSIEHKSAQDLQPIVTAHMPTEIQPVINSLNQLLHRLDRHYWQSRHLLRMLHMNYVLLYLPYKCVCN
jgi:hypothetical protein